MTDRRTLTWPQPSPTLQSSPCVVLPAFQRLGQAVQVSMERAIAPLRVLGRTAAGVYRDPVYIEGMKARYAVRAALDPTWADPLSPLRLLNPSPETWEDVAGMTRAHRIEIAVAALRAHAEHRPLPPPAHLIRFGGLVEHRVIRQHTFTVQAAQERTVTTT
jgi:hypothetical protein